MESALLSLIIFLPLIVAFILMIATTRAVDARNIAFITTIIILVISIRLYIDFEPTGAMQFETNVPWIKHFGINYHVGLDGFSLSILLLIAVLIPAAYLMLWDGRTKGYWISMLLIQTGVTGALLSLDLILFYFFWEVMLLPVFLIIGMFGKEDKVASTLKVTIYTMAGSLLMFLAIIYMGVNHFNEFGVWSFDLDKLMNITIFSDLEKQFLFFAFVIAFSIKIPLFPFHTWIVKTYQSAPTGGVFLLSSIMAKLGVYAVIRFLIPLFPDVFKEHSSMFVLLGVFSMIYFGIAALKQDDIKAMFAYSSASHLGLISAGFFSLNPYGLSGAVYLIMAHAIATGGLFLLVGVIEFRKGTRKISELGGIAKEAPLFTIFFAIMLFSNIGIPGTSGFVSELLIIIGIFQFNTVYGYISVTTILIAASFMMWMFQRSILQSAKTTTKKMDDMYFRQIVAMVPLSILVFAMGMFPDVFMDKFEPTIMYYLDDILKVVK
jgi:NADH-quinone oxidoreductase subunit M